MAIWKGPNQPEDVPGDGDDLAEWVRDAPDEFWLRVRELFEVVKRTVAVVADEHLKLDLLGAVTNLHAVLDPAAVRAAARPHFARSFAVLMELDPAHAQRRFDAMPPEDQDLITEAMATRREPPDEGEEPT